jgi:hypothetical protein
MKSYLTSTLAVVLFLNADVFAWADTPAHVAFLDALIGNWDGQAVQTPRGPLPYDIDFTCDAHSAVNGTANPDAALHHWRFLVEGGKLRLRFLTTFGGNTTPIWLNAETVSPNAARFRADHPPYLHVEITNTGENANIEVFLRDKPHVHIRLARTPPSP